MDNIMPPDLSLNISGYQIILSSTQLIWMAVVAYLVIGWLCVVKKFFNEEYFIAQDPPLIVVVSILYLVIWLPVIIGRYVVYPILRVFFKLTAPFFITKENRKK